MKRRLSLGLPPPWQIPCEKMPDIFQRLANQSQTIPTDNPSPTTENEGLTSNN